LGASIRWVGGNFFLQPSGAVAIPIIPRAARVVRATALSVKENQYIEAVQALGALRRRVVLQHIVPTSWRRSSLS